MSDHSKAFIPIDSWAFASPELRINKRMIDVGLFCESLIYYDGLYVNIVNQTHFAEFVSWFYKYHNEKILLDLLNDGSLKIYEYAFASAPINVGDRFIFANLQDEAQAKPNSFPDRYFDHPSLVRKISDKKFRNQLYRALEGKVVEKKASDFGAEIDASKQDFRDAERPRRIMQLLIDEVYRYRKLSSPPQITCLRTDKIDGKSELRFNFSVDELSELAGRQLNIGKSTIMNASIHANRFAWSAANLGCDLYLPSPLSAVVGDKLLEVTGKSKTINGIISELQAKVEFPNIRKMTNDERLGLQDIVKLRREAMRFREWLQQEGERDRDAIIAYHNEVGRKSGLARVSTKTLSLFGAIGAGVLGAMAEGPALGGALSAGGWLLGELVSRLESDWKPVVFGNWLRERVEKISPTKPPNVGRDGTS